MNKIIEQQLKSVKLAQIPNFDSNTTHIVIPKYTHAAAANITDTDVVHLGRMYIVELADYILNEPNGFTLHANWNNNIKPSDKYMKILTLQDLGKMVKIKGVGYDIKLNIDLNSEWIGWCPKKSLKILKELDI